MSYEGSYDPKGGSREHQLKALRLYVLCQSHTNTSFKCVKHSKFL